jgi:hypothetical protein
MSKRVYIATGVLQKLFAGRKVSKAISIDRNIQPWPHQIAVHQVPVFDIAGFSVSPGVSKRAV